MPITLLTSPPGTGKTLKAVDIILQKLNEGYVVFSNILGLKIPYVFNLEIDSDWRDLDNFKRLNPDLSEKSIFVVIDECHEWKAFGSHFTKTKLGKDFDYYEDQRLALSMHRHFGYDFLLITQNASRVFPAVRDFTSTHLHMIRPFGMKYATIYRWREVQDNIGRLAIQDAEHKERFKYPKYLFKLYTSSEIHTVKAKLPYFWISILLLIILVIFYVLYQLFGVGLFNKNKEIETQSENHLVVNASAEPVKIQQVSQSEENLRIAMIIESSSDCKAYNSSGDRIVIDIDTCKTINSRPTNMSFSKNDRSNIHSHLDSSTEVDQSHVIDNSLFNETKTYS